MVFLSASRSPTQEVALLSPFRVVHLKDCLKWLLSASAPESFNSTKSWILPILIKCIIPMPVFILLTLLMTHEFVLPHALSIVTFSKNGTGVITVVYVCTFSLDPL